MERDDIRDPDAPVHETASEMLGNTKPRQEYQDDGDEWQPMGVEHNWPGYTGWALAMIISIVLTASWELPYRWVAVLPIFGLCFIAGMFMASQYPAIYPDGTVNKNWSWGLGTFLILFLIMMVALGSAISTPDDVYEGQHVSDLTVESNSVVEGDIFNVSVKLGKYANEPHQIELDFQHSSGFHMSRRITIQKSIIGSTSIEAPGAGAMVIRARPVGVSDWEQEITVKIVPRSG